MKTATPLAYDEAGQVISYGYHVTNTGNVTIHQPFTIDDDKATDESCPDPPTSLAPGEAIDCTASYTITLADLDLSKVKSAVFSAGARRNYITGDLLNFTVLASTNGVLDAPPGQSIFYSRTPTNNHYLNGDTYFLKSGGKLRSLAFGTVVLIK